MEIVRTDCEKFGIVKLADVAYGQVFMLPGQGHVLVKVNKEKSRNHYNLNLSWTPGYCLAFNPKRGTIRALDGSTEVQVLKSKLCIWEPKSKDEVFECLK